MAESQRQFLASGLSMTDACIDGGLHMILGQSVQLEPQLKLSIILLVHWGGSQLGNF